MTDNRRCYTDELNELVDRNAPREEIYARMQELIDRISGLLSATAREIHPLDYPFVVACMELSCANQRSLYSDEQLELVENLKAVIQRLDRTEEDA